VHHTSKSYNLTTGLKFEGKKSAEVNLSGLACELWYSIRFDHAWAEHEKLSSILSSNGYTVRDLSLFKLALDAKASEMAARARQHQIRVEFSYGYEATIDEEKHEEDTLVFGFNDERDAFLFRLMF